MNGLDLRISQHVLIVSIRNAWFMDRLRLRQQIFRNVTYGVQLSVARLPASIQVGNLRNRSATEDADAEQAGVLFHGALNQFHAPR
jgi:hypothetical protein